VRRHFTRNRRQLLLSSSPRDHLSDARRRWKLSSPDLHAWRTMFPKQCVVRVGSSTIGRRRKCFGGLHDDRGKDRLADYVQHSFPSTSVVPFNSRNSPSTIPRLVPRKEKCPQHINAVTVINTSTSIIKRFGTFKSAPRQRKRKRSVRLRRPSTARSYLGLPTVLLLLRLHHLF
jgi:hypothetical protein